MDAVKIFKALSDENRLRILKLLESGELCVCDILARLELSPSTVSEHLSVLKSVGLVVDRREGKWIYYALNNRCCTELIQAVLAILEEHIEIKNFTSKNSKQQCCPQKNHSRSKSKVKTT